MKWIELLDRSRQLLRDKNKPYLFTDDAIYARLSEAQLIFCQRTGVQTDRTHYKFKTVAPTGPQTGTGVYYLPKTILKVLEASIEGRSVGLIPFNLAPWKIETNVQQGQPTGFTTNLAFRTIAFDYVPDKVYTVDLLVITVTQRFDPDTGSDEDEPAIPWDFHHYLPYYVAYQSLMEPDVDTVNADVATKYEEQWLTGLRDAKRIVYNYRAHSTLDIPRIT